MNVYATHSILHKATGSMAIGRIDQVRRISKHDWVFAGFVKNLIFQVVFATFRTMNMDRDVYEISTRFLRRCGKRGHMIDAS